MCDCRFASDPDTGVPEVVLDQAKYFPDTQKPTVAVDPSVAGMGLGGKLLELAESEGRKQRKFELRLSTHINMPENVKFYERRGWQETGRSGNKVLLAKAIRQVSQ